LSQLFSDTLGLRITIADTDEAGALGVALCAGIGSGCYASYEAAVAATCRVLRRHEPDPGRLAVLDEAYRTYLGSINALTPFWPDLRASDDLA
jgi:L-xylulokinase